MELIVGIGTGRCGTQTFAKMFDLPHEKCNPMEGESSVSPDYLNIVPSIINKYPEVKAVCLKRNKNDTIRSFISNQIMGEETAIKYYNYYYARAEEFQKKFPQNFRIFPMESLDDPKEIEEFIGKKSLKIDPITGVCPLFKP